MTAGQAVAAAPLVPARQGRLSLVSAALALVLFVAALSSMVDVRGLSAGTVSDLCWFAGWLGCALCGSVLVRSTAGFRFGLLMLAIGGSALLGMEAGALAAVRLQSGPDPWGAGLELVDRVLVTAPQVLLLGLGATLFPDGRLPSRRRAWRLVPGLCASVLVVVAVAELLRPGRLDDGLPWRNPWGLETHRVLVDHVEIAALAVLLLLPVVGLVALARRWRHGPAGTRAAVGVVGIAATWLTALVLVETTLALLHIGLPAAFGGLAETAGIIALPLASITATVRRRAFDVELALNRNLTYLLLTVVVVGGYAVAVGAAQRALEDRVAFGVSLLLTGLIAVVLGPLKLAIQRGVERLLVGQRGSPYHALTTLGRHIDDSLSPLEALQAAVTTVARTFRLPYVALSVVVDGDPRVVAEHGLPAPVRTEVPLTYGGRRNGTLGLAPRSPGERFNVADRRLIDDLASRIAGAVEAVQLTEELRRSRADLVRASEDERRRIRRELHDGIGPVLAGTALAVGRVERQLGQDDHRRATLAETRAEVQQAIADIRRIVHDLRPAALDELGLVAACRQRAAALSDGVVIEVHAPAAEPLLSAAVEVAAYRLVGEALTNVVRHAAARSCQVVLEVVADELVVAIRDDGVGVVEGAEPGVGFASMRERVAELGGRLSIETGSHGTEVTAWLPTT
jgi:signal transduction histidine kinase